LETPHIPVLLQEVVESFKGVKGNIVDCTLGYGGHSEALLKAYDDIKIIGIDRDKEAIWFSKKRLEPYKDRVEIIKGEFANKIEDILKNKENIGGILADIGVSSLQLDKKDRGFSFDSETLDMRMNQDSPFSAKDVVNHYSLTELERVLKEYGEMRDYKKIAAAIVKNRPFNSAKELAEFIKKVRGSKHGIHPATTLFQAIRIEVNKELNELERLLKTLENQKLKGTRVAIITFHSLEDRIVKNYFKKWSKNCICPEGVMRCECGNNNALGKILTKKPITSSKDEIKKNPRSRSAKLRVFEFKE
jgi:16S rRNA (cytosine1402-N4)-methyltransferase